MKRIFKRLLYVLISLIILAASYYIYLQTLYGVHPKTVEYYHEWITEMRAAGYPPNHFVSSTYRPKWFNDILVQYGGAASRSQHLEGRAIDIVVLDVNQDGRADSKDVDIVFDILNRKVIGNKGGIGTYKNQTLFFDRQMVHFDSRGRGARWHR